MRYIDLERVTHIRSIDVRGYRHNNKGFYENFTFLKSINKGRTGIIGGA